MNDDKYPDLEFDPLYGGDCKTIRRIPGMRVPIPQIKWGDKYRSWPVERRLEFAEKLASAMNHAADVLQQEKVKLIEELKRKEEQLKSLLDKNSKLTEMMNRELAGASAEKQELAGEVVRLRGMLREQAAKMKELEGGDQR